MKLSGKNVIALSATIRSLEKAQDRLRHVMNAFIQRDDENFKVFKDELRKVNQCLLSVRNIFKTSVLIKGIGGKHKANHSKKIPTVTHEKANEMIESLLRKYNGLLLLGHKKPKLIVKLSPVSYKQLMDDVCLQLDNENQLFFGFPFVIDFHQKSFYKLCIEV